MKRAKRTAGQYPIALDPGCMTSDPRANLALFERAARKSHAFGDDLPFDAVGWPIQVVSANRRPATLSFTVHNDGGARKDAAKRLPMKTPFVTFLKSVIRLSEAAAPSSASAHRAMLRAGRYLHDQSERCNYDPVHLTSRTFQEAERAALERDPSPWSNFAVAQNLLKLSRLVRDYKLTGSEIAYVPVTPAPDYNHLRVGPGRDPGQLPSAAALRALPNIAQQVVEPADVCMMSVLELLHCAPWRIGEVLSLPERCEVVTSVDGRLLGVADLDAGRPVRYGLRYKPEKSPGLTSDIKWIPSAAVPLARRAIENLRKHTAEAREVAAYMEKHPGRAWLPASLRLKDRLGIDELAEIVPGSHGRNDRAYRWLHANEIAIKPEHVLRDDFEFGVWKKDTLGDGEAVPLDRARRLLRQRPNTCLFEVDLLKGIIKVDRIHAWLRNKGITIAPPTISRMELEARLLSLNTDVSPDFPWKRSECLLLFPTHFFRRNVKPLRSVPSLMRQEQLSYFLMGNAKQEGIFERFGHTEDDGDPIHVTSHMYRRWLATLAMDHEMSAAEVQNWLGHSSELKQVAYDHRTPDQLGEDARRAIGNGLAIGPIADIALSINEPRERETFLQAVLATAHITPYGMCARDWLSSPCARHGACAACDKQLIRKGDLEHRKEVERSLRENLILLERAQAEADDGQVGAGNHARHLAREVAVLEATLEIHESPSIADGTYVQLDLDEVVARAGADR
ncbi:hypothetical protein CT676_38010 [Bradyrhizobium sp. MOS001]|uniref:hypothetical protein n=1 Tax=Bradyrhizobium sp. MOS001 TaxID=2133948 RepID=UPI00107511C9|nr:hypothetical protein [Bradyrhizobium sp. MOS001]TFW55931.1 hypothetical protein CT676_38010 [Bradyrhizobium sp. MOS001]